MLPYAAGKKIARKPLSTGNAFNRVSCKPERGSGRRMMEMGYHGITRKEF